MIGIHTRDDASWIKVATRFWQRWSCIYIRRYSMYIANASTIHTRVSLHMNLNISIYLTASMHPRLLQRAAVSNLRMQKC